MSQIKHILDMMKIPVTKKLIEDREKEIIKLKEQLKDDKYNPVLVQAEISHTKGYIGGLKYALEELESLRALIK